MGKNNRKGRVVQRVRGKLDRLHQVYPAGPPQKPHKIGFFGDLVVHRNPNYLVLVTGQVMDWNGRLINTRIIYDYGCKP